MRRVELRPETDRAFKVSHFGSIGTIANRRRNEDAPLSPCLAEKSSNCLNYRFQPSMSIRLFLIVASDYFLQEKTG
jgi:hypothetical protein